MFKSIRVLLAAVLFAALLGVAPATSSADTVTIAPDGYTPPPIKVAVVYSQTTIDWLNHRGTPSRYPHGGKEAAVRDYLRGRGYDVTEIVGDRDLLNTASLMQYDVVVLPSMYAMGKQASESLARYVAAGGGLVSTMSSPRVDPAHAPRRGQHENMNEWWWRVMGSNYWEWGPLSAVFQAKFVNDGAYTPRWSLSPNPSSPIVQQASAILTARGHDGSVAGLSVTHPACNIEMALPIPGGGDRQTAADFNIQTASVRAKYRAAYTAILGTKYGTGRSVKFFFPVMDFLRNYNTALYSPLTPTGFPQGEVAGAYLESSIIWAASGDGTAARTTEATTYANVSAKRNRVTATQRVINTSNTITKGNVRFTIYTASGRTVKTWVKKNVLILPHQTRKFSYTYKRRLPSGVCTVVARFDYGYPIAGAQARTQASIVRGQYVKTQ